MTSNQTGAVVAGFGCAAGAAIGVAAIIRMQDPLIVVLLAVGLVAVSLLVGSDIASLADTDTTEEGR